MNELVAFCIVALSSVNQTMIATTDPIVKYKDIDSCLIMSKNLGKEITVNMSRNRIVAKTTCGCMGIDEAIRLKILSAPTGVEVDGRVR